MACLEEITQPGFYASLLSTADRLHSGLNTLLQTQGIQGRVQSLGCRFGMFFGIEAPVRCYRDTAARNVDHWHRFVKGCFDRGIYFQSIGHAIGHAGISASHTAEDIDWVLNRMEDVLKGLRS